jgi:hypothetical protein
MASRSSFNPLKVNRYPRQVPKQLLYQVSIQVSDQVPTSKLYRTAIHPSRFPSIVLPSS